jgi:hypothetical protein
LSRVQNQVSGSSGSPTSETSVSLRMSCPDRSSSPARRIIRSAVGAVNIFVTPYFSISWYGRAGVGVSMLPSKMTWVAP